MWLMLGVSDAVQRANSFREFPFDTSGNTLDLLVNGYGSNLKSAATITATIPVKTTFDSGANESMNGFTGSANFELPSADAGKTGTAGQATGMVSFKWAAASWGGSCCKTSCED